jgi:hypothetical protein
MIQEPKCSIRKCVYFQGVSQPDGTEMSEVVVCQAFPDGIPDEIAYGGNLHTAPFPGQVNDIVFKESKDG